MCSAGAKSMIKVLQNLPKRQQVYCSADARPLMRLFLRPSFFLVLPILPRSAPSWALVHFPLCRKPYGNPYPYPFLPSSQRPICCLLKRGEYRVCSRSLKLVDGARGRRKGRDSCVRRWILERRYSVVRTAQKGVLSSRYRVVVAQPD